LKKQLTLDKQEEWETDRVWQNLSAAAKCHRVDEDKTEFVSEIAQHHFDKSEFSFAKMHLLNNVPDHIHQLCNFLNAISEHPERAMMDIKQAYQHSNYHEAASQILRQHPGRRHFSIQS